MEAKEIERIVEELKEVPKEKFEDVLKYVQSMKEPKIHRFFKGRPVVKVEELKKVNCPFPLEPEWKKEWEDSCK